MLLITKNFFYMNVTFKVVRPLTMENVSLKVIYERQLSDFDISQIPNVLSVLRVLYPDPSLNILVML